MSSSPRVDCRQRVRDRRPEELEPPDVARSRDRLAVAPLEHEQVVACARRSGTRRSRPARPARSSRASPIACRGCGPPSGRFMTLMKYGAGATSRNSTVRSSSARTPMRSASSLLAEVVLLPVLEHEVDGDRRAGAGRIQHALDAELDVVRGQRRAVRPGQPFAQVEDVAQAVVGDLPALGERRHDRPLRPRLDEPVEELHAELDVRPRDRRLRVGVVRQEAVATRSVAVGAVGGGSGGVQSANARWYASFASSKRSDVCSASASLKSTSAISCRSPRASRSGSSAR